jgi:hypothetical protein
LKIDVLEADNFELPKQVPVPTSKDESKLIMVNPITAPNRTSDDAEESHD